MRTSSIVQGLWSQPRSVGSLPATGPVMRVHPVWLQKRWLSRAMGPLKKKEGDWRVDQTTGSLACKLSYFMLGETTLDQSIVEPRSGHGAISVSIVARLEAEVPARRDGVWSPECSCILARTVIYDTNSRYEQAVRKLIWRHGNRTVGQKKKF